MQSEAVESSSPLTTLRGHVKTFASRRTRLIGALRTLTQPLVSRTRVEEIPGWVGRIHGIKVPKDDRHANPAPSPVGSANIKILFKLLEATAEVEGEIAECGVFRGSTIIPMGLFIKQHGIPKKIYGFDSFEGFPDTVDIDLKLGGAADSEKRRGGFGNTSFQTVSKRVEDMGVTSLVTLHQGFFQNTLSRFGDRKYSFVHIDCDIYQSYKECLEFFYRRLSPGGIILFDEYNDPPWPGCNKAVDEFLADKPEKLEMIQRDNEQKWYLKKLPG